MPDLFQGTAEYMVPVRHWPGAACEGYPTSLFYPHRGEDVALPKSICQRCELTDECLEWALTHNERFGIWGGTAERERRRIRERRGLTRHRIWIADRVQ